MSETTPRRPEAGSLPRAVPPAAPRAPRPRLPEPPAYRARAPGAPAVCANCSGTIGKTTAPPLCWGCGRALCVDCYWRHGLTPSAHRCTSCLARGSIDATAISGGRAAAPASAVGGR